jgi:hypothetical protein
VSETFYDSETFLASLARGVVQAVLGEGVVRDDLLDTEDSEWGPEAAGYGPIPGDA